MRSPGARVFGAVTSEPWRDGRGGLGVCSPVCESQATRVTRASALCDDGVGVACAGRGGGGAGGSHYGIASKAEVHTLRGKATVCMCLTEK